MCCLVHPLMVLAEEKVLSRSLRLHLSYTACLECTDVSFWERASWSVHTHMRARTHTHTHRKECERVECSPMHTNSHFPQGRWSCFSFVFTGFIAAENRNIDQHSSPAFFFGFNLLLSCSPAPSSFLPFGCSAFCSLWLLVRFSSFFLSRHSHVQLWLRFEGMQRRLKPLHLAHLHCLTHPIFLFP